LRRGLMRIEPRRETPETPAQAARLRVRVESAVEIPEEVRKVLEAERLLEPSAGGVRDHGASGSR